MDFTFEDLKTAQEQYLGHVKHCRYKIDANRKAVQMKMSFDEWLFVWALSGHWRARGRKRGQFVMSRINDLGHYELGNVFIQDASSNVRDAFLGVPKSIEHVMKSAASRKGLPKTSNQVAYNRATSTCPHCGIIGAGIAMKRWHFSNCRKI